MGKRWSQTEIDEVHHLYKTGISAKVIANIMQRSANSVRYIIYKREPSGNSIDRLSEKRCENVISESRKQRKKIDSILNKIQKVFFPVKKG